jgi:cyanophycin synthetase
VSKPEKFDINKVLKFSLTVKAPKIYCPQLLKAWLRRLEIDFPDSKYKKDQSEEYEYIQLGALLLKGLLVAGNIPHFEIPEVAFFEKSNNKLRFELSLGFIDFVPLNVYQMVVVRGYKLLALLNQLSLNASSVSVVYDRIHSEIIHPLKHIVTSGKSTMHVLKAAHVLEIPFFHLGLGIFQLGWGSRGKLIDRSTTENDSAIGARICADKWRTAEVLKLAGLPCPQHFVVSSVEQLESAAVQIRFPMVVKPADAECGVGVSVDISDKDALNAAYQKAISHSQSRRVLVEKQVAGVCHRLFIAHGKLLYAVKRDPMKIFGDGKRTIAQIISDAQFEQSKRPPWLHEVVPSLDQTVIEILNSQRLAPETIPELGKAITLRRLESTAWGGVDEEVTSRIHPDNLSIALQATKLLKLSVAGVDIITTNITEPWYESGAIINEINYSPLLGGAEISRSYLSQYLKTLITDSGKIPIESYKTQGLIDKRYQELSNKGLNCFSVTPTGVQDHDRKPLFLIGSVQQQVRALLLRDDVDAVLVLQPSSQE